LASRNSRFDRLFRLASPSAIRTAILDVLHSNKSARIQKNTADDMLTRQFLPVLLEVQVVNLSPVLVLYLRR
jgi:hypothetical protein